MFAGTMPDRRQCSEPCAAPWRAQPADGSESVIMPAVHPHAIYVALNESRTWGEFRRLLPAREWPAIEQRLFLGEDGAEDDDRSHWEEDDAPFCESSLLLSAHDHGFCQPLMDVSVEALPPQILAVAASGKTAGIRREAIDAR